MKTPNCTGEFDAWMCNFFMLFDLYKDGIVKILNGIFKGRGAPF